uniref:Uncharacterized protein n=1 Tax=Echinococcus canadensis TaxID=519352 RepID=A0A915EWT3_9CEST
MTTSKMYWLPLLHAKAESKCIPRNLRSIRFIHLVHLIMQIFYKKLWYSFQPYFSANEDLQCNDRRCKVRAAIGDYVRVERGLDFGIQASNPPHDPFCHPNYNVCHNYSGTTFIRISGDFNKKDVTRLVLSKGRMDATLLIHRMSQGRYPGRGRRILYTTPPVLTIEDNYTISRPVQIAVPYFSSSIVKLASEFLIIKTLPLQLPKCAAYFGPAKVEGVFNVEEGAVLGQGGVQLKWTGSLSSVKIHGKVVQVPFEIAFLGEQERGEEFTFTFLSSPSQKYSLLNSRLRSVAVIVAEMLR